MAYGGQLTKHNGYGSVEQTSFYNCQAFLKGFYLVAEQDHCNYWQIR